MRLDHILSKEHWQPSPVKGVVVYSSLPGRSFLGDGASDCGTLTIRPGSLLIELVLPARVWNVSEVWVMGRGALLGPEESGRGP